MQVSETDALIVVDMQNDFCPGGALPVNDGHRVAGPVNKILHLFEQCVFTRDWHPPDHCSFAEDPAFTDGSWPVHCVADSPGAEFHGDLHVPVEAYIVSKGSDPDKEQYSGFEDSELASHLKARGVKRIFVAGLATEFCVKSTVLDGLRHDFEAVLLTDACRGLDSPRGSTQEALDAMRDAKAAFCVSTDLHA